jgi:hypothetical protein
MQKETPHGMKRFDYEKARADWEIPDSFDFMP